MCFNAKLKILEHRQQRIAEVRAKYEWLMKELEMTKQYLMLDPNKWLSECKARAHAHRRGYLAEQSGRESVSQGERVTDVSAAKSRALGCLSDGESCPERTLSFSGGDWDWWGQQRGAEHCSCKILICLSPKHLQMRFFPLYVAEDHPDVKAVLQICSQATRSHCISSLK